MKHRFKFMFLFLFLFSINPALPKISISGSSIEELKHSMAEFEAMFHIQEDQTVEPQLGFADIYLKRVGDQYDKVANIARANQRFLKLTGISGAFVYGKFINPEFFPNIIQKVSTASMGIISTFFDSILKGALNGVMENKGFTGKIVGGLIIYSVINNMLGIGLKSATEYFVSGSKRNAENRSDRRHENIRVVEN